MLTPATAGAFGPVGSFDGTGSGSGQFNHPQGAVATGATVYVADTANNRVPFYSPAGVFQSSLGGPPAAPADVAVAPDGTVTAAGPSTAVRWILGVPLVSIAQAGTSYGVAVDAAGTIYVSDTAAGVIRKYNGLGASLGEIGAGQLSQPQGLTADGTGIYVADTGNGRIVKLNSAGAVLGIWTMPSYTIVAGGQTITGKIEPHDVAVDSSGRLFVPDAGTHSNLLAVFGADGTLQQIIGSPDSDPGNPCKLSGPWGVAVTGGTLYVVSTAENRVRVLDESVSPCPVVNFGAGGGINPPLGGDVGGLLTDQKKPKVKLRGIPKGCARRNFAFTIRASDDVLLKRLTLFINHRRVANQHPNTQRWSVNVKIPVRNVRSQLPHGASLKVLVEVRVVDATGKKAKARRAFRICG
jgi:hypothetical protein